nr:hypothetical protein [Tanacetum cinerariifolium]
TNLVIPKSKANLPYPSRLQKEKLWEKDDILAAKFMEIFRDLHFELTSIGGTTRGSFNHPGIYDFSNTIPNPKGEAKAITTRSGMSYKEPPITPPGVEQQEPTEETTDTELPSPEDIQPPLPTLNDTKMVLELVDRTISKPTVGIDFESEEIEDFLNDDSMPFGIEDSPFNMDEDILFLKSLLSENPIPPHPIIPNQTKLSIEETNHSLNMGYEHFNTNLLTKDVAESSTKNLIPIPNEYMIVLENESQSTEPVNDNSLDFTIISNPLLNNDKINSDVDTEKSDYLDEFYGPFIHIHILEEERTRKEHADYINRMEMLFTINSRPHNSTNVKSFSSFQIPNQESEPRQEEIDVISVTNDLLPPRDDDSDEEVDDVGDLRVDNFIQNSEHEYSESEDSDFDNPPLPLPPPEPPDKEFDFEKEISVEFSLLSAENEDTIFDPDISD